jgi:hypothetical protein
MEEAQGGFWAWAGYPTLQIRLVIFSESFTENPSRLKVFVVVPAALGTAVLASRMAALAPQPRESKARQPGSTPPSVPHHHAHAWVEEGDVFFHVSPLFKFKKIHMSLYISELELYQTVWWELSSTIELCFQSWSPAKQIRYDNNKRNNRIRGHGE